MQIVCANLQVILGSFLFNFVNVILDHTTRKKSKLYTSFLLKLYKSTFNFNSNNESIENV